MKLSTIFLILFISFSSCGFQNSKSDITVEFTQDTLAIGYTYWWSQKAPFSENCTSNHSLVFSGTVQHIASPNNDSGPLYTSQKGLIEIEKVYQVKDLGKNIYAAQKFITTDCFYESGLESGDKVLVFCYDYENDYSIPGKDCIIKIDDYDDPLIASTRKLIDNNNNPIAIKRDIELWSKHELDENLEANIKCAQEKERMFDRK